MGEAISRRELRVLVPGKRGMDGCGTDQTTDMDHRALQFIKHQVLWSDPYHNPNFREGGSFCLHFTDEVTEPCRRSCDLLKFIALGARTLRNKSQEPAVQPFLDHITPILVSQAQSSIPQVAHSNAHRGQ